MADIVEYIEFGTEVDTEPEKDVQQEVQESPAKEAEVEQAKEPESNEAAAKPQSKEDNARFAEQRRNREAENERLIEQRVQQRLNNYAAQRYAGINFNGAAITTMAQADAYEASMRKERHVQELIDNGISKAVAERMANDSMRLDAYERQMQASAASEQERAIAAMLQRNIDDLNKAFPNCGIKTADDLAADTKLLEAANRIADGNLVDAYYLAHRDDILAGREKAIRQAAINSTRAGEHMRTQASKADTADDIHLTDADYAVWEGFGYSRTQANKFAKGG